MMGMLRKCLGGAMVCGIALFGFARAATAQDSIRPLQGGNQFPAAAPQASDAELRARIERLERQNEDLMRALQTSSTQAGTTDGGGTAKAVGTDDIKKIVKDYLQETETKKKAEAEAKEQEKKAKLETEGYRIGSDLSVKAYFDQNGYFWLATPNNDFKMHIGFWLQNDYVWWSQSPLLRTAPGARSGPTKGVASGVAQGGIGDLQDGVFFRRIRPFLEGTLWETSEYRLNLALENNQFSTAGLDEVWVAQNYIPVIGTARVGHVKTVMGLEADMTGSSRTMTFLERSSYSEAIELNQNFTTGLWFSNNFLDQRMTYSASAFRVDNGQSSGAFFGDGQWGAGARLTFLPIYECDGRHWLHLGIAGGWRNGTNNLATSPDRVFQLRARPELRDDTPAASPAGAQVVPNANSNRMIDTGPIAAADQWLMGLEFLYVRGPFSVQAEYGWNWLHGAYGVAPAGLTLNPAIVPPADYVFNGGYVQVAYTLTGEARGYDRKYGTLSREYFGKTGNFSNAWLVRGEDGLLNWGLGAWELAARWSYVDLNDGTAARRIQGGKMDGLTVGLNWYLNNNIKWQFDWVYDHRYNVPVGVIPGYTSGFGTRVQLSF